jgi:metallo-beta-lactamase class B
LHGVSASRDNVPPPFEEVTMSRRSIAVTLAAAAVVASAAAIAAQSDKGPDAVAAHKAAAAAAAGQDFAALKTSSCGESVRVPAAPAGGPPRPAAPATPPVERWHAEPVKVFDNFYFIGTREHGAWALTTSEGLIVIDALYDYAVIDEVEGGLKKLGLDPGQMKYLIITHGHGDHHGGTKYLQDKYRPRVVMGPKDWELVARDTRSPRPTKDMDATDGQKITLGDTTVTIYITPGHTPTTLSLLVPVKDNGVPHMAVEWGGTALNAQSTPENIQNYINSAARFRGLVADARADVIFTNHTTFDGTRTKLAAVQSRQPGQPHPFVVGPQLVARYLTVVEECAKAMLSGK